MSRECAEKSHCVSMWKDYNKGREEGQKKDGRLLGKGGNVPDWTERLQESKQGEEKPGCGRWQLGETDSLDLRRQWVTEESSSRVFMFSGIEMDRETEK